MIDQIQRWVPGVARRAQLPTDVAHLRSGRRGGARRHPRAAGHGLRRAGGAACGHRAVHDHRLPGRLRGLRAVEGARPRARLVDLADDPRRDHAADGHRRPHQGGGVGRHAGDHGRPDRGRSRPRSTGVRRRPPVQRGADRLPQRAGRHHHREPAPEAVRVLDRRRRVLRRDPRVRDEPRPDRGGGARRRPRRARRAVDPAPVHTADPRGAHRRGRRHRRVGGALPLRRGRGDGRRPPPGLPESVVAVDLVRRRGPPVARRPSASRW